MDEKRFTKNQAKEAFHNIILENRRKLSLAGVEDVDSFDEECITLYTQMGTLAVRGSDLHINKLSVESGEVIVEGEIDSLSYSDDDGNRNAGFFKKLFR